MDPQQNNCANVYRTVVTNPHSTAYNNARECGRNESANFSEKIFRGNYLKNVVNNLFIHEAFETIFTKIYRYKFVLTLCPRSLKKECGFFDFIRGIISYHCAIH